MATRVTMDNLATKKTNLAALLFELKNIIPPFPPTFPVLTEIVLVGALLLFLGERGRASFRGDGKSGRLTFDVVLAGVSIWHKLAFFQKSKKRGAQQLSFTFGEPCTHLIPFVV